MRCTILGLPLILVSALAISGCGGDDVPVPETKSGPIRLADTMVHRDFLNEGTYSTGASIPTTISSELTRGSWELKSSRGSAQAPVKDEGGFPPPRTVNWGHVVPLPKNFKTTSRGN